MNPDFSRIVAAAVNRALRHPKNQRKLARALTAIAKPQKPDAPRRP